jgi:hypothetical protein
VANHMRVTLEIGPKGKKVVAVAADWPGLARGATTEEQALERVRAYVPRYAPVAKLAGMEAAFATSTGLAMVERYPGTGSTDFWEISFGFSSIDQQVMAGEGLKMHRDAYCHAIRDYHAQGKVAGKWPLRYLIRHTAFHTLDHAWEMADKDLSAKHT